MKRYQANLCSLGLGRQGAGLIIDQDACFISMFASYRHERSQDPNSGQSALGSQATRTGLGRLADAYHAVKSLQGPGDATSSSKPLIHLQTKKMQI